MMNKILVCLTSIVMLVTACDDKKSNNTWIEDENIDMSDELLLSDESVLTSMPEYSKVRGGESETLQRSFENAPPLIPHRVGGFLPIKVDDNKCLRCHLPENAPKFEAIPLPKTHFTSYRPVVIEEEGIYRVDAQEGVMVEKDLGHFNGAMFNCSQCHVPQAKVTVDISNVFDPDYRKSSNKTSSNLNKNIGEGVR